MSVHPRSSLRREWACGHSLMSGQARSPAATPVSPPGRASADSPIVVRMAAAQFNLLLAQARAERHERDEVDFRRIFGRPRGLVDQLRDSGPLDRTAPRSSTGSMPGMRTPCAMADTMRPPLPITPSASCLRRTEGRTTRPPHAALAMRCWSACCGSQPLGLRRGLRRRHRLVLLLATGGWGSRRWSETLPSGGRFG